MHYDLLCRCALSYSRSVSDSPRPKVGNSLFNSAMSAAVLAVKTWILPWRTMPSTTSLVSLLRSSVLTCPATASVPQLDNAVDQIGAVKFRNDAD